MKKPFRLVLACLAIALAGTGPVDVARAHSTSDVHYPDLRTLPPKDLKIAYVNGTKVLRFSNTVWNAGPGPFETRPRMTKDGTLEADQWLYDGSGNHAGTVEIGTYEFHDAHGHWHLTPAFAKYELLDDEGKVKKTGQKTTWCIIDGLQVDATVPHATSTKKYTDCGQNSVTGPATQGLSVSWGDVYKYTLPDQWVEVQGLPDGYYILRSTANPADRSGTIQETDLNNNSNQVRLRIRKNKVSLA
jgi:hypothetical protein